jgi:hypothetical protein
MGLWGEIGRFISGSAEPSATWKGPGRNWSYDWCRYRRDSQCYLPERLDVAGTAQAGYNVWVPKRQGHCPRVAWDAQRKCHGSDPGLNVKGGRPDATIPWQDGGQRLSMEQHRVAKLEFGVPQESSAIAAGRMDEVPGLDSKAPFTACAVSQRAGPVTAVRGQTLAAEPTQTGPSANHAEPPIVTPAASDDPDEQERARARQRGIEVGRRLARRLLKEQKPTTED